MTKRGSSGFRFVSSNRRGQYSVWRGDKHLGYVTKIVHRVTERGATRTILAGWRPSTIDGVELALEKTREAAAKVLAAR